MDEQRVDTAMGKLTPDEEKRLVEQTEKWLKAPRLSLWQRFKIALFGGEGRVDDLFK